MKRARTESSKDDRKQFILDCAEDIIEQGGLKELSIAKVGKKSKLSIGTIYLYFENKEEIIGHLTLKSRQVLLKNFHESIINEPNALNQVSNFIYAYFKFYKEYPFYNQLVSYYESNTGLEEPEYLKSASLDINMFVVKVLQEGKKQGLIRQDLNELEFSFLMWGTAVGILQLIDVKKEALENNLKTTEIDFFNSYIQLIINSLKK
ncbi:MAG: TetR/AcrR family transcriptional regulator [Bacteroidetes bacterium]|nr:MAG: TetR/AcrR family transcriptional regulator [Bacteroidota bacterium]